MKLKNGMQISIDPMAAILFAGMLLTDRTHIVVGIFIAATAHELGHLLAARLLGIPLRSMRLDMLGARLDIGGRILTYGEEWALCAAGPIFSLLLAAVPVFWWDRCSFARELSCLSLLLGGLNLLPIRNFDGGRMLASFLSVLFGERVSERVITVCSVLFVLLLWSVAVYFLLRVGDGLSLFCFSMSLFFRFFGFSEDSRRSGTG